MNIDKFWRLRRNTLDLLGNYQCGLAKKSPAYSPLVYSGSEPQGEYKVMVDRLNRMKITQVMI